MTGTLDAGTGYLLGSPSSESVTVRDDDEPAAPKSQTTTYTIYHDPNRSAAAGIQYDTAIPLLKAAGRSYLDCPQLSVKHGMALPSAFDTSPLSY